MQRVDSSLVPVSGVPSSRVGPLVPEVETEVGLYYIFIEEILQRGALGAADRFLAPGFVEHGMSGDRLRHDYVAYLAARRARFPDAVWTIESLAGVGGLVVCYLTMSAQELPEPGWESVVIRFVDGKIAECWSICDSSLILP